jgi:hypothetical protein
VKKIKYTYLYDENSRVAINRDGVDVNCIVPIQIENNSPLLGEESTNIDNSFSLDSSQLIILS